VSSDSSDEPVALTSALDDVVRSLRGGADRSEVRGVFGQWEEAVGPAVASHVRPIRLEGRALLVEVDEPALATQVRLLADDLRSRLRAVAGVSVERIDVRVAGRR
jgi:predicted nucleic acid-binding Zn ribbon protein